ncbi:MAG: hypothetical protein E7013_04935 [Alphaproteobacteria bacterium]|nr:hypothetical protein [Alphaproteobacteria bacterium]
MQNQEEILQSDELEEKKEIFDVVAEKIYIMTFFEGLDCTITPKTYLGGEIGLDSLNFLELDVSLSEHFKTELNLEKVERDLASLTMKEFVDLIYARKNNLPDPDLKRPTLISRFKPMLKNLFNPEKTKE